MTASHDEWKVLEGPLLISIPRDQFDTNRCGGGIVAWVIISEK